MQANIEVEAVIVSNRLFTKYIRLEIYGVVVIIIAIILNIFT
jgi:hypothetical protein